MLPLLPLLLTLLLTATTGCDRKTVTDARVSRLYANALDDLQAGRMDAAIAGFERVTLEEPKMHAAHFQLATLLEDVRKDHVGALAHFRIYCALSPKSDKARIAKDRMRACEDALVEECASRTDAIKKFESDKTNLEGTRDELLAKLAKCEAERNDLQEKVRVLTAENESQRKMIAKFSGGGEAFGSLDVKAEAIAALKALKADDQAAKARRVRPSDADLVSEAAADRAVDLAEAKRLNAALDADEPRDLKRKNELVANVATNKSKAHSPFMAQGKKDDGKPTHPKTYVVQEGDTLFALAMRFYGKKSMWRVIREANRAVVPPDGRLRRGQELRLP